MTPVGERPGTNRAVDIRANEDETRAARPEDRPAHRPDRAHVLDEGLWDISQVSTYLQIPISSIYKMTARRAAVRIPHIRIGNKLRFRRADVDAWLTLLTHSDIKALATVRRKVHHVTHGDDSQTETP